MLLEAETMNTMVAAEANQGSVAFECLLKTLH